MAEHRDLDELFVDIAGQIRAKKGTSNPIKADDLPYEVSRIISEGGVDTSDATATVSDLAEGKTAYFADGGIHQGTQPVRDYYSVDVREDSEGNMVARVPNGIYKNSTDVVLTNAVIHKPANTVERTTGKVTVTPYVEMTKGFQPGGSTVGYPMDITASEVVSGSIAITPTSSGFTQDVTNYANAVVSGDVNLIPQNVKKDVTIFGTVGTLETQGIDPSDATATADDIALNKTAYIADGSKAVGTQPTKSSEDITFNYDGSNLVTTIPRGLYKNTTYKNVPNATVQTPGATLSISGNSATFRPYQQTTSGYITSGTRYGYSQTIYASDLTSGNLSVTPTKAGLVTDITTYSTLTVQGESNLIPGNIAKDVSIFGVVGTLDSGGVHTSDATATAADILAPKTAYISDGTKAIGTIETLSAFTHVPTTTDINIPAGKYLGGAQTIKGDPNLVSSYIAKDVSIFGVTGTLEAFQPAGTINISANGLYDVYSYASAQINVSTSGGGEEDWANWVNFGDASAFEKNQLKFRIIPSYFAFENTNLTSVYLPNCQTIHTQAFTGCQILSTFNAPNCINLKGSSIFENTIKLSSINLNNLIFMGSSSQDMGIFRSTYISEINLSNLLIMQGSRHFEDCKKLKNINLPLLSYIPEYTFVGAYGLEFARASMVSYIASSAFQGCKNLSVVDISNCEGINYYAFAYTSALETVNMNWCGTIHSSAFHYTRLKNIQGNRVTNIYNYAFQRASLINIDFPQLLNIYNYAFTDCYSLETIRMSPYSIGSYAFNQCSHLKSVYLKTFSISSIFSNAFPQNASASYSIFVHPSMLSTICGKAGWSYLSSRIAEMPTNEIDGVYAYQYYTSSTITEVTDSSFSNPRYILQYAFSSRNPISTISLNQCSLIGQNAFNGCTSISTLNLPNCKHIDNSAFYQCTNIQEVSLPLLNSIGTSAFYRNLKLQNLDLPECKYIGSSAFAQASLISVSLPECLWIGSGAFQNNKSLTTVYAPKALYINTNTFWQDTSLTQISADNCRYIGNGAFSTCTNLSDIHFNEVRQICNAAFSNCIGLTAIDFPNCVSIETSAFYNISQISYINLPQCKFISDNAFYGVKVSGLKQSWFDSTAYRVYDGILYENSTNKPKFADYFESKLTLSTNRTTANLFQSYINLTHIEMSLANTIADYICTSCTSLISADIRQADTIGQAAFTGCYNLQEIMVSNNINTIYSNAFIDNRKLSILSGASKIVSIGNQAFWGCASLKNIPLQETTYIGASAFLTCTSLESISANNISIINYETFRQCYSLKYVSLPNCYDIGTSAFVSNYALSEIYIPNIKQIGQYAFCDNRVLKSIYAPLLLVLSSSAFNACSMLSNVYAPNLSRVNQATFYGNYNLNRIDITECKYIGSNAFAGCSALSEIALTKCSYLEGGVFSNCHNLTQISLPSCTNIGQQAFWNCYSLSEAYLPVCQALYGSVFLQNSCLNTIYTPECKSIYTYAIRTCSNLTSLSFPMCNFIAMSAIGYCNKLSTIRLFSTSMVSISTSMVFTSCSALKKIYVPYGLVSTYKTNNYWSYYSSMLDYEVIPSHVTELSVSQNGSYVTWAKTSAPIVVNATENGTDIATGEFISDMKTTYLEDMSIEFPQNMTTEDITRTLSYTRGDKTVQYDIVQKAWVPQQYSIESISTTTYQKDETINPDTSTLDGVYWTNGSSSARNTILKITLSGYTKQFKLYLRLYGTISTNPDIIMASILDASSAPMSGSDSNCKKVVGIHKSGTTLSDYVEVTYDIPDQDEHIIYINSYKFYNASNTKYYVLIEKANV